jgi:hypothetical protein
MMDRPESWNAKMLSGEPLITDERFEKLLANAPALTEDHDPLPVVKIFVPHVRWMLIRRIATASSAWSSSAPGRRRWATCFCRTSCARVSAPALMGLGSCPSATSTSRSTSR